MRLLRACFVALVLAAAAPAGAREVVITIDDLPRGGDGGDASMDGIVAMTEKLLAPFREQSIRYSRRTRSRSAGRVYKRASRGEEVLGTDFPQILLIHANELNADVMPELLAMLRRRGYTFVTLEHALADEAYAQAEAYVGRGGFSWIHRWSRTRGLPPQGEPEPPAWVVEAFEAQSAR